MAQRRRRTSLAGSDGLNGYMARRHGAARSGAFLDPLADKACVLGPCSPWPPRAACRGFLPSFIAIREDRHAAGFWVGRRGVSIPARKSAKIKTLVQDIAIGTVIIPPRTPTRPFQVAAIWFACALTLYTGAEYLLDGRRAMHRPVGLIRSRP